MRSMGENLGELERVKEVLKGDITHQFTDIINEAAAELNMDQADFQVTSFSVLRIRDVYPGSDFFPSRILDPNCFHPGSRILIKEFKYFNPQKIKKMVSKLLKI
jgi:hypothetical protein